MIQHTEYEGWKALKLSTEQAELIMPTDIGPRVISCALKDGTNLFTGIPEHLGGKGEKEFTVRGGHRLWHSPEHPVRTYEPDNDPVDVKILGENGVTLTPKPEPHTGIQKQMTVEALNSTSFRITQRLTNNNLWPVNLGAWGLSIMRPDGYGVVPLPPKKSHEDTLLPDMAIIPWTYTDLSLPSWQFHSNFLGVDMPQATVSQKIGFTNFPGWLAYWTPEGTFVKYFKTFPNAIYPDLGCRFEIYTCNWMIELESLSPMVELAPQGGHLEHVEYWGLIKGLPKPDSDKVFTEKFRPVIEHWLAHTPA
jgi:hypothetical protein